MHPPCCTLANAIYSWPDGSLKWSGHALAVDAALSSSLTVTPGDAAEHDAPIAVSQDASTVVVTTGSFKGSLGAGNGTRTHECLATFNTAGDTPVASLVLDGLTKAQNGQLVAHIQAGPDPEVGEQGPPIAILKGTVSNATVEQQGPLRAVIKARARPRAYPLITWSSDDGHVPGRRPRAVLAVHCALLRCGRCDVRPSRTFLRVRRRPERRLHQEPRESSRPETSPSDVRRASRSPRP